MITAQDVSIAFETLDVFLGRYQRVASPIELVYGDGLKMYRQNKCIAEGVPQVLNEITQLEISGITSISKAFSLNEKLQTALGTLNNLFFPEGRNEHADAPIRLVYGNGLMLYRGNTMLAGGTNNVVAEICKLIGVTDIPSTRPARRGSSGYDILAQ